MNNKGIKIRQKKQQIALFLGDMALHIENTRLYTCTHTFPIGDNNEIPQSRRVQN